MAENERDPVLIALVFGLLVIMVSILTPKIFIVFGLTLETIGIFLAISELCNVTFIIGIAIMIYAVIRALRER